MGAVVSAEVGDLELAEGLVRDGVLAMGARLLEAGLAARGSGKREPASSVSLWRDARCVRGIGPRACRRWWAGSRCVGPTMPVRQCGHGHCPLDAVLGLSRDSLSPGVRRVAGRLGALLPFAEAARTLAETARVQLSASTLRAVTETVGARYEQDLARRSPPPGPTGCRRPVACRRDGSTWPWMACASWGPMGPGEKSRSASWCRSRRRRDGSSGSAASYVAGLEPAAAFGQRLALEAHRRGLEGAGQVAVLGDGAEWIWQLAAEHCPARHPDRRLVSRQ